MWKDKERKNILQKTLLKNYQEDLLHTYLILGNSFGLILDTNTFRCAAPTRCLLLWDLISRGGGGLGYCSYGNIPIITHLKMLHYAICNYDGRLSCVYLNLL